MNANIRMRVVLSGMLSALSFNVHAQVNPTPAIEARNCDPCVPASVRQKAMTTAPAPAQTLSEAVTQRLKARFDGADVNRSGTLTRAQAEAGGFGFISLNFDAIDRRRAGAVTFDDVKSFLVSRGAKLD